MVSLLSKQRTTTRPKNMSSDDWVKNVRQRKAKTWVLGVVLKSCRHRGTLFNSLNRCKRFNKLVGSFWKTTTWSVPQKNEIPTLFSHCAFFLALHFFSHLLLFLVQTYISLLQTPACSLNFSLLFSILNSINHATNKCIGIKQQFIKDQYKILSLRYSTFRPHIHITS